MISCWTWSVISKLWLFPSQLLSKACSGGNQLSSPSASRIGPSSVPWVCTWVPGLETAGGDPTPGSLPPPCPTHTIAKKRNLTRDWPSPARGRQGNEALLGQRTEQTPGLQHAAGVQEKERGGVARPPPGGAGSPQNVFMQHLGVRGLRVLLPPLRTGLLQFLEAAARAG